MACMNLGIQITDVDLVHSDGWLVARLGDGIRAGNVPYIRKYINRIWHINISPQYMSVGMIKVDKVWTGLIRFSGNIGSKKKLEELKRRVELVADTVEKAGY
jgi:hypothetical protein